VNTGRSRAHGLWTAASLLGLSVAGFLLIDVYNAERSAALTPLRLETPLDAVVPFVPWFVFAYVLYYPWLLIPLFAVRRAEELRRVIVAFTLMQISAAVVFLAVPSHMSRPTSLPDGLAGSLLRAIYEIDPGWNAFPSLHAGHSVLVAWACWRYRRSLFPLTAIGTALIAASTVLIKQHYVIDVVGGALLAWACMHAADGLSRRVRAREHRAPASRAPGPLLLGGQSRARRGGVSSDRGL